MEEKVLTQKIVSVKNRDNGEVFATLSNGRVIEFNKGQTKKVNLEDILDINSTEGGRILLKEYLVIQDSEVLKMLEMNPEPEYYYTEAEIRTILTSGTLEQLEDCLDFAPGGVIDILKDIALEIELPDTRKRKIIADKIGFDIDNVLFVKKTLNKESDTVQTEEGKKVRRTDPIRKTEPVITKNVPDYKVLSVSK